MPEGVFERLDEDVQVSCWKQEQIQRVGRFLCLSIEESLHCFDTVELSHRFVEPSWTCSIFVCFLKKRVVSGVFLQSVESNTKNGGKRENG